MRVTIEGTANIGIATAQINLTDIVVWRNYFGQGKEPEWSIKFTTDSSSGPVTHGTFCLTKVDPKYDFGSSEKRIAKWKKMGKIKREAAIQEQEVALRQCFAEAGIFDGDEVALMLVYEPREGREYLDENGNYDEDWDTMFFDGRAGTGIVHYIGVKGQDKWLDMFDLLRNGVKAFIPKRFSDLDVVIDRFTVF